MNLNGWGSKNLPENQRITLNEFLIIKWEMKRERNGDLYRRII